MREPAARHQAAEQPPLIMPCAPGVAIGNRSLGSLPCSAGLVCLLLCGLFCVCVCRDRFVGDAAAQAATTAKLPPIGICWRFAVAVFLSCVCAWCLPCTYASLLLLPGLLCLSPTKRVSRRVLSRHTCGKYRTLANTQRQQNTAGSPASGSHPRRWMRMP